MTGPRPVPLEQARAQAEKLVGQDGFAEALRSPTVEGWIRDGIAVFRLTGRGTIPEIVVGDKVVMVDTARPGPVFAMLERILGIEPSTPE